MQSILQDWFSTKYPLENATRVINNDTFTSKMPGTRNSIQSLEDRVEESLKKVEQKDKENRNKNKEGQEYRGRLQEVQHLNNMYARNSE